MAMLALRCKKCGRLNLLNTMECKGCGGTELEKVDLSPLWIEEDTTESKEIISGNS